MAYLKLYRKKLQANYKVLQKMFDKADIDWGVVTKVLCGNRRYLQELVDLGIKEMHDTRISNLKAIKAIAPDVQTVYIKPPAKRSWENVVKFADVSFNTELATIRGLSVEAVKQKRIHKVIIMVEMGDLREGVVGEALGEFYAKVFKLPGIEIIGIGTNLNCLNGVMPSTDKLIQLSLYKQLIEARFNKVIPWVSGGTTVALPLLLNKELPQGVNHFRIGEALYFGADLFHGGTLPGMNDEVFKLYTEVIELYEKPVVPTGDRMANPSGRKAKFSTADAWTERPTAAIIDVGLLDVQPSFLIPDDEKVTIIEASSDMLVVDLGESAQNYKVGDTMTFGLKYMGALSIMNSRYI
ncbi:MAG: alanine/ornithine racemase family PLP-dependent enzyme, partial [Flavobacteriales bacterium]|nr:alanine/ornithine racemase family PLP-dependent enzyme [Flavobacteriales bacterium]